MNDAFSIPPPPPPPTTTENAAMIAAVEQSQDAASTAAKEPMSSLDSLGGYPLAFTGNGLCGGHVAVEKLQAAYPFDPPEDMMSSLRDKELRETARKIGDAAESVAALHACQVASRLCVQGEHALGGAETELEVEQTVRTEAGQGKAQEVRRMQRTLEARLEEMRCEADARIMEEVQKVRLFYSKREKEIANDVKALHALYQKRIGHLEGLLKQRSAHLAETKRELEAASLGREDDALEVQRVHEESDRRALELCHQIDKLRGALKLAGEQEKSLKDTLAAQDVTIHNLDQMIRLERAQHEEVKYQLISARSLVEQLQREQRQTQSSYEVMMTETDIMREEVAMLENEKHRIARDKTTLALGLAKMDKLVYGSRKQRSGSDVSLFKKMSQSQPARLKV